jgi:hypothetical protein
MSNFSSRRSEVEAGVRHDVHFAAVEDRHRRKPLAHRGDFLGLLRDPVGGQRA